VPMSEIAYSDIYNKDKQKGHFFGTVGLGGYSDFNSSGMMNKLSINYIKRM